MKAFLRILASLAVACLCQVSAQTGFTLNLGGATNAETIKSSMVFSGGGVSATARSWSISRTDPRGEFTRSEIVQWSPGIGSKNSSEAITTVPYVPYYVDNEDHYDLILFVFDQKVELTSLSLTPSGKTLDTDVSYWFGNVDPNVSLTGDNGSGFSSFGFGSMNSSDTSPGSSARSFNLTGAPTGGVNALLVGARVFGDSDFDRFKISAIRGDTVVNAVPEPGATGLIALGFVLAGIRRRR